MMTHEDELITNVIIKIKDHVQERKLNNNNKKNIWQANRTI